MHEIINNLLITAAVFLTLYAIPKIIETIITKNKKRKIETNTSSVTNETYQEKEIIQPCKPDYAKIKGEEGEHETYKAIQGLDAEFEKFLFNVYIPTGKNQWTEIDIIYISRFGVYVIENKNYSGWVFGDEYSKIWTIIYNKDLKHNLYNPLFQNQKHVLKVEEVLLKKGLNHKAVKSIICFNDKAVLKQVPQSTNKTKITNTRFITKAITENGELLLNETEINKIYNTLKIYENVSEEVKQQHIRNIKGRRIGYYYRNRAKKKGRYYRKYKNK